MNVLVVLSLVLLSFYTAAAQSKEDFTLVKKDGNISIYERWITFPKSDPPIDAREVKGEFYFNNTIYAGIKLLQNEAVVKQWQNHVSEFKVYPLKDTTTWLEYSYHDIPWPVSDQDHFLAYKIVSIKNGKVFIAFESKVDEKRAPLRKSVTRMDLSGSWTFEQITPTKVKATYRILSRPLNIPKWLTDPIIRNNMMTTIKEFITLIEKN
ncbi:MAG TPA: hypothetical protein VD884_18940 [Ohtaekwangia sp.]|nr:hypothetical protein [Ohtaekwangia sp.]